MRRVFIIARSEFRPRSARKASSSASCSCRSCSAARSCCSASSSDRRHQDAAPCRRRRRDGPAVRAARGGRRGVERGERDIGRRSPRARNSRWSRSSHPRRRTARRCGWRCRERVRAQELFAFVEIARRPLIGDGRARRIRYYSDAPGIPRAARLAAARRSRRRSSSAASSRRTSARLVVAALLQADRRSRSSAC